MILKSTITLIAALPEVRLSSRVTPASRTLYEATAGPVD